MTAGEMIAQADSLRPNHYTAEQKLLWLQRLDGQLRQELLQSHEGEQPPMPDSYGEDTALLAPAPYDSELDRKSVV